VYEPKFKEKRPDQIIPDTLDDFLNISKSAGILQVKENASLAQSFPLYIMDDKPHDYVLQNHHIGRSFHGDLRIKRDGVLDGITLAYMKKGTVKEDVKTLEQAKEIEKNWSKYCKLTDQPLSPKEVLHRAIYAELKDPEPVEWLNFEGVVPPGEVGARVKEHGVFNIVDRGKVWYGAVKPYFVEFFFKGKRLTGRWILRMITNPWKEDIPGREFVWLFWKPMDQTPYVLSERAVEKRWIPPIGISCLPPWIRDKIPDEYKYWLKKSKNEALKTRDELVEAIKAKKIRLQAGSYEVYHIWWTKRPIIRRGPSQEYWLLHLQFPEKTVMWMLTEDPTWTLPVTAKQVSFPSEILPRDWEVKKIPPGTKPNPMKDTPMYIQLVDKGKATLISHHPQSSKFRLEGKKLNKVMFIWREDPNSNMWVLEESTLPPL